MLCHLQVVKESYSAVVMAFVMELTVQSSSLDFHFLYCDQRNR